MNDQNTETVKRTPQVPRLLWLGLLLGVLYVFARATGLDAWLQPHTLRQLLRDAGFWGVPVFAALFAVGLLVQIPGVVFVAAAVLVYGQLAGGAISLVAALVALSVTFFTVRSVGRAPGPRKPSRFAIVERALARLERHPVCTVALLRVVMFLSPPVNYALALSSVRYRDYIVGSSLGLVLPLAAVATLTDLFV